MRALAIPVQIDGGIFFRQRLALTARDLKIRIPRHAEFPF